MPCPGKFQVEAAKKLPWEEKVLCKLKFSFATYYNLEIKHKVTLNSLRDVNHDEYFSLKLIIQKNFTK
jgi:hypothetical protein